MASPGNIITNYYFSRDRSAFIGPFLERHFPSLQTDWARRVSPSRTWRASPSHCGTCPTTRQSTTSTSKLFRRPTRRAGRLRSSSVKTASRNCFAGHVAPLLKFAKCISTCELWTGLAWSREMPRLWLAFRESALRQVH